MNHILFCILWSTILYATGGQLNGDPAPGRSPGPPALIHSTTVSIKTTASTSINSTAVTNNSDTLKINDVLFDTNYDDDRIGHSDNQQSVDGGESSTRTINHLVHIVNNVSNKFNAIAGVENDVISVHVQTELPVGRKPCNSVNTLYDYLNNTRIYRRKLVDYGGDDGSSSGISGKLDGQNNVVAQLPSSTIRFDVTHDAYDIDHGLVNNVAYAGKSRLLVCLLFLFFCLNFFSLFDITVCVCVCVFFILELLLLVFGHHQPMAVLLFTLLQC